MARYSRVLCCVVILSVSVHEHAAVNQRHFVRIPLESNDQLRFTGAVRLGSLPRRLRVVFDTGSSDTWVTSAFATNMDDGRSRKAFAIGYGGGIVSGFAAPADLQLGCEPGSAADGFFLRDVRVGFVDDQTSVLPELDAHGVVGLGMEALVRIHSNTSLVSMLAQQQSLTGSVAFSIYISSWSGAQPASQVIIGGSDPVLTSANTTWFSFPVISNDAFHSPRCPLQSASTKDSFGFWALRLQSLTFDNVTLPLGPKNRDGAALLDSGTSVLLLPQHLFDSIVQALFARFGARLLPSSSEMQTLPSCRPCQVHEFPPLAFDFFMEDSTDSDAARQRFELRGSDYVRCDHRRRECTAMIDFIHSSEISDHLDVMILGTVFFRAYYARFDYSNKQVSLACTLSNNGVCRGGLKPALDYQGQPNEPYCETQQPSRSWAGICAATTALTMLAGLPKLVQSFENPLPSSSSLTKQHR